ncbi:MAG: ABC transporter permease subunit [Actinomycetota bacterium]|nr:ABC transporter permease subunit [Actinomycetota bacterium]
MAPTPRPSTLRLWPRRVSLGGVASVVGILVVLVVLWEGYKVLGKAAGGLVPFTEVRLRPPPDDRSMPHVWDIVSAMFEPARRRGEPLWTVLGSAALFTLREAFAGFVVGGLVGFGLGVWFVRSRLAERALLPYVVASQTVPILAIAPMVVIWGGRAGMPQWTAVAIIAAYLTFYPVTINTLRGLRSPAATATELMRSYAASDRQRLWKLQVPAALPYIFTALKISAAASVVGAIVGELPTGASDGLGRALLSYSQQFTAAPERLYATVVFCGLAGITFVAAVALVEQRLVNPGARQRVEAETPGLTVAGAQA